MRAVFTLQEIAALKEARERRTTLLMPPALRKSIIRKMAAQARRRSRLYT